MKKIFSSPDPIMARVVGAFIESKGLQVEVRGEQRISGAGGLPPTECWPELFVEDELEGDAQRYVKEFRESHGAAGQEWTCPTCGEELEAQFSDCWRCQPPLPSAEYNPSMPLAMYLRLLVAAEILLCFCYSVLDPPSVETPVTIIYLLTQAGAWIGLLLLANFGRYLKLLAFLLGLIEIAYLQPPHLRSGTLLACHTLLDALAGATLALAFLSPLANVFRGKANGELDSRETDAGRPA